MSGNDYVKFMTQEIVKYMELPQDERRKRKKSKKKQSSFSSKWFGLLPFAFKLLVKKKK
ncbi:YqzE family protein [Aquibacillus sp. 3ASR75-11]|uniref:YqzE family protein n=1 Tax=Terrihalobacillus insolitus TaxID=2950438 RepID=A0A9X4ANY2_9BACI|nr:YqzE family protein [Terrihalobacillus insolitus]MDC3413407.1 YqzE family protein [Terrihalobacillus insolitus]MDC3424990.1 YqzE family protein [Terrihalobacillus insolitus]